VVADDAVMVGVADSSSPVHNCEVLQQELAEMRQVLLLNSGLQPRIRNCSVVAAGLTKVYPPVAAQWHGTTDTIGFEYRGA
jgi:hypothetical protein